MCCLCLAERLFATEALRVNRARSSSTGSAEAVSHCTSNMASTSTTTMRTATEGPSSSTVTKTTTYESRSSYVADSSTPTYRPTIAPRTYIIQRTSVGALGSAAGGGSVSRSVERSAQFGAMQAGAPAGKHTRHLARLTLIIPETRHNLIILHPLMAHVFISCYIAVVATVRTSAAAQIDPWYWSGGTYMYRYTNTPHDSLPHCKRHLDKFIRFAGLTMVTNTRTDTHTNHGT